VLYFLRMGSAGRSVVSVAALAGAILLAAPAAHAAVTIGSSLAPAATSVGCTEGTPCTFLGTDVPPSNIAPDGLRSPIDGVVVRWRVKSGSAGNPVKLRVMSPATDPEWTGVGTSAARATVVGTSPFFATRLRISAGDGIGVDDSTSGQFFGGAGTGFGVLWSPQLGDGETRSPTVAGGVPLVQAQVEGDSDRDGFGDESQDDCPGEAGGSNGCETTPPETIITRRPQSKVKTREKKKKVRFKFVSSEPGSVFRCDTDEDLPTACRSPYKSRFPRGKHNFEVVAIDAAGNADPTPAMVEFRVKRKH
jgi:hypothetical protein